MTTMTEMASSPHDPLGGQRSENNTCVSFSDLPNTELAVKQTLVPLFSQPLLTVEQLSKLKVDADIQTAVDDFLKGLTTQMFAKIVRNGSAEVGRWLGAKVQAERDGWTAMVKMAMGEIEHHRKTSLQAQVLLHDTLDQLRTLVAFFQVRDDVKQKTTTEDLADNLHWSLHIVAACCNALVEDRFRCVDILGCADLVPDSLSSLVQNLKDKVSKLESERETLKFQNEGVHLENAELRKENKHLLEEVKKMEGKMKCKQADLETLKSHLQEIDQAVTFRKVNTADKSVGTSLEWLKRKGGEGKAARCSYLKEDGEHGAKARENMCTQTLSIKEASFIELSEERLRVLKERAQKLENSLHGAIASMDKLRKRTPKENSKPSSSSSTSVPAPTAAMFVALPTRKKSKEVMAAVASVTANAWVSIPSSSSLEVTNHSSGATTTSTIAAVPKLGHFKPTERRCYSERPAGKSHDDTKFMIGTEKGGGKAGIGEGRKGFRGRAGQVSKCLRCRQLFTATDNHKLACCYHSKGKERLEVYSEGGQLINVKYVWKCCQQQAETDGCCYGCHV